MSNKYRNKQISNLVKAEQGILLIYNRIEMNGEIPSPELVKKQIRMLRKQKNDGSGVKYLFTCC